MNAEPISYKGDEYRDDRMYVINLTYAKITIRDNNLTKGSTAKYKWVLATYRNNLALPSFRSDQFESKEKAIKYLKDVEMQVPLISNNEQPLLIPDNIDKWTYWLEWLKKHQLFSAITEKQHMPFWQDSRGFNNAKDYMQITEISE